MPEDSGRTKVSSDTAEAVMPHRSRRYSGKMMKSILAVNGGAKDQTTAGCIDQRVVSEMNVQIEMK